MIRNLKIFVELFAYLSCLSELFGKKLKISIHVVVLIILGMFLAVGIDDYDFPEYLSSLVYICIFLYGLLYYGKNIKLTLVNCFLAAVVVAILQLLIFLPLYYLFFRQSKQGEINELLINVGCFMIIILCSYRIKLKRLSDFCIKRNRLIVGVSVLILCGLGYSFFQIKDEGKIVSEVLIPMIYFILIFLFTMYEWQKSRMDVEKKKAQLEMNRLYYDAYDQLIMLVRERQHDMKSHISAILGMIYTTDNYEELVTKQKEYCDYIMGQHEKTKLVLSIENPLIAGFMYSKIQEAENKDIKVDYHVEMQKDVFSIPEYELVEMAGILFDNAIEALSNVDEIVNGEKRLKKIRISLKETKENIVLAIANTSNYYDEDMTERFFETEYSNKGKGRGIGLPKLKRMVQDRKGDMIVSNEMYDSVNYLQFSIIMPIKEKKQKF